MCAFVLWGDFSFPGQKTPAGKECRALWKAELPSAMSSCTGPAPHCSSFCEETTWENVFSRRQLAVHREAERGVQTLLWRRFQLPSRPALSPPPARAKGGKVCGRGAGGSAEGAALRPSAPLVTPPPGRRCQDSAAEQQRRKPSRVQAAAARPSDALQVRTSQSEAGSTIIGYASPLRCPSAPQSRPIWARPHRTFNGSVVVGVEWGTLLRHPLASFLSSLAPSTTAADKWAWKSA